MGRFEKRISSAPPRILDAKGETMTTGGWIFMLTTWTAIISLVIFCFWKMVTVRAKKIPRIPGEDPAADRARTPAPGGGR